MSTFLDYLTYPPPLVRIVKECPLSALTALSLLDQIYDNPLLNIYTHNHTSLPFFKYTYIHTPLLWFLSFLKYKLGIYIWLYCDIYFWTILKINSSGLSSAFSSGHYKKQCLPFSLDQRTKLSRLEYLKSILDVKYSKKPTKIFKKFALASKSGPIKKWRHLIILIRDYLS